MHHEDARSFRSDSDWKTSSRLAQYMEVCRLQRGVFQDDEGCESSVIIMMIMMVNVSQHLVFAKHRSKTIFSNSYDKHVISDTKR